MNRIRADLWRLHPGYWWELLEDKTSIPVRVALIRMAFRRGLDDDVSESISNAPWFQYSIDQVRQDGRAEGAKYVRDMLRFTSAEDAVESLLLSVQRVKALQKENWNKGGALYHASGTKPRRLAR